MPEAHRELATGPCHENTAVTRPPSCASASASAQRSVALPCADPSIPTTTLYVISFTTRRPRDRGIAAPLHLLKNVSRANARSGFVRLQLARPGCALTLAGGAAVACVKIHLSANEPDKRIVRNIGSELAEMNGIQP
jgi:hypothetical protein